MTKLFADILSEKALPVNFIRFYLVGLLLFIVPFTRGLFISITSLSLLLVIAVVLYYHRPWNKKTVLFFLFIILSTFFFEMAGVATGKIFGHYYYERGLGIQWNGTPLIIGFNWLFLTYASHDIAGRVVVKPVWRVVCASLFMLFYDMVMEWVAPVMHMWEFYSGYPPLSNFIAWFVVALLLNTGFEFLHILTNNKPARILFVIQLVFFLLIGLYNLIFI